MPPLLTKLAGFENMGTFDFGVPALSALAMPAASSTAPSSSTSQPAPPVVAEHPGTLTALRFHGVGMSYAKLKQSKKTPSMCGDVASGGMIFSRKNSRTLGFPTFQIAFQHLRP